MKLGHAYFTDLPINARTQAWRYLRNHGRDSKEAKIMILLLDALKVMYREACRYSESESARRIEELNSRIDALVLDLERFEG